MSKYKVVVSIFFGGDEVIGVYDTKDEAQAKADEINEENLKDAYTIASVEVAKSDNICL